MPLSLRWGPCGGWARGGHQTDPRPSPGTCVYRARLEQPLARDHAKALGGPVADSLASLLRRLSTERKRQAGLRNGRKQKETKRC